ncbi:MAG: YbbR-like domain-containing protein [Flavobacteriaceae bacterium]
MEKRKDRFRNRKIRLFLASLLCSALIWLVSNLSETYAHTVAFGLHFVNAPDSLLLKGASSEVLNAKVRATGFAFLGLSLGRGTIALDVSKSQRDGDRYFLSPDQVRFQLQRQLPNPVEVLQLENPGIYFDFQALVKKEVPIKHQLRIALAQNHMLVGELQLQPDSVVLKAPESVADTISFVATEATVMENVTSDIDVTLPLQQSGELAHVEYSHTKVRVYGKVSKFSERVLEVPVTIKNAPLGARVRSFPSTVKVLCKAPVSVLSGLSATDFEVSGDLGDGNQAQDGLLSVQLTYKPASVFSAELSGNTVEYIINITQ